MFISQLSGKASISSKHSFAMATMEQSTAEVDQLTLHEGEHHPRKNICSRKFSLGFKICTVISICAVIIMLIVTLAILFTTQKEQSVTIARRYSQLEHQFNVLFFSELELQLKVAMDATEQKISLLNETIAEKNKEIEELSTQNAKLRAQHIAMNESLQLTRTELQLLMEETQDNVSNLSRRFDESAAQQVSHTRQLFGLNQSVEEIEERISMIEINHTTYNRTLIAIEQKIDGLASNANSNTSAPLDGCVTLPIRTCTVSSLGFRGNSPQYSACETVEASIERPGFALLNIYCNIDSIAEQNPIFSQLSIIGSEALCRCYAIASTPLTANFNCELIVTHCPL